MERVELSCHTYMSRMDGLSTEQEYIDAALEAGHMAVGIMDTMSVQSFPRMALTAERLKAHGKGFKIIYGMEALVAGASSSVDCNNLELFSVSILVQTQEGLYNLYRLLETAVSSKDKTYIMRASLSRFREGLLFGSTGMGGELYQAILQGENDRALEEIARFYDYLEVCPLDAYSFSQSPEWSAVEDLNKAERIVRRTVSIGNQSDVLVAATGNVHFVNRKDALPYGVLKNARPQFLYFRSTAEMMLDFLFLGKEEAEKIVYDVPVLLADRCSDVQIRSEKCLFPDDPCAIEEIEANTYQQLAARFGEDVPDAVQVRVKKELAILRAGKGYATAFNISKQIADHITRQGYAIGSRGCISASYIAYLLGITDVDPIRFNIPYETLFGLDGEKYPDIDFNLPEACLEDAVEYIRDFFPEWKVVRAGVVQTLQFDRALEQTQSYFSFRGTYKTEEELQEISDRLAPVKYADDIRYNTLIAVESAAELEKITPVMTVQVEGRCVDVIHYQIYELEGNLSKLDLIPHTTHCMLKRLREETGVICKEQDALSEENVEHLAADLENIPGFEAMSALGIAEATTPKTAKDLMRIFTLAHSTDAWDGNAKDLLSDGIVGFSEIIACRDDIMLRLTAAGVERKLAFRIMERVRKGSGLREEWEPVLLEAGIPQWYLDSCNKISYLFPKAHGAAYTLDALKLVWYKTHFAEKYAEITREYEED